MNIDFKNIITVLVFLAPGFLSVETANFITGKKNHKISDKDKFYSIIIFSAASIIFSNLFFWLLNFIPFLSISYFSLKAKNYFLDWKVVFVFVLSLLFGTLWGWFKENKLDCVYDFLSKKKITNYVGDEPLWDTLFNRCLRDKGSSEIPRDKFVKLRLRNGLVFVGEVLYYSCSPYIEAICIKPNHFWYEQINNELRENNKKLVPPVFKSNHYQGSENTQSLYIEKSEILFVEVQSNVNKI